MSKHRGKLETKVKKFRPLKDANGFYIPFCTYHFHPGISMTPEICERRKCTHYLRLYIPKERQDSGSL